jgi:hypothetical protein
MQLLAFLPLALSLTSGVQETKTEAATPAAPQAEAPKAELKYHTQQDVVREVAARVAGAKPDTYLAEAVELPPTGTGLPIPAFAFGAPGPTPLIERPTILLLGGLDGISLAGSEAVLATCARWTAEPDRLPRGVTFVAVPRASPEALGEIQAGRGVEGKDLTPIDEDGDDAVDEDGPDDLDGDGKILWMLVEDPSGPYVRSSDPRFLAPARDGDAPRYRLAREGKDDDGDGRYNEDGPGGVVYDRSFPIGWRPGLAPHGAELPLELPPCRALADLALARKTVLVLLFQGDHGGLARPGAMRSNAWPADADAASFALAGSLFSRATGRGVEHAPTVYSLRGEERPGSAIDWFYAVPGALALEVAPWGPSVERPPEPQNVGFADARFEKAAAGESGPADPSAVGQAWGRWLDNLRGGIGFVEWHPVELGEGARALVGGFEPSSRLNPPEKVLGTALAGLPEFVLELSKSLPALDILAVETRREGDVCTLRSRVRNTGALPTGGAVLAPGGGPHGASSAARGVRLELELPAGARLLAGDAAVTLDEIPGGGASREVSWIVLAGPSTVFSVRASARWAASVAREVKP